MSSTSPQYEFWRNRPTLKVWQIAALMHGVDPRAMTDATDGEGDAIDMSNEIDLIISAALVNAVVAYPRPNHLPDNSTEVATVHLLDWLREVGYATLADELDNQRGSRIGCSDHLPWYEKLG